MTRVELVAEVRRWRNLLNRILRPVYEDPRKYNLTKADGSDIGDLLVEMDLLLTLLEDRVADRPLA